MKSGINSSFVGAGQAMDFIRSNGWPPEHAKKAYDAGYFIEAIQVLHGWIEAKLQELMMVSSPRSEKGLAPIWDETLELSLIPLVRILTIQGILTDGKATDLRKFNSMRN